MNLPNFLTMIRLFLIPAYFVAFFSDTPWNVYWAFGIILLAGLTDVIDGYVAKDKASDPDWNHAGSFGGQINDALCFFIPDDLRKNRSLGCLYHCLARCVHDPFFCFPEAERQTNGPGKHFRQADNLFVLCRFIFYHV